MNYRVASAEEDLGELPLDFLLENYSSADMAGQLNVLLGADWKPLWPWLQKQREERAAARLAEARAAKAMAMPAIYRRPMIASALNVCGGVGMVAGVCLPAAVGHDVPLSVSLPMAFSAVIGSLLLFAAAKVIDLLAQIEANTTPR